MMRAHRRRSWPALVLCMWLGLLGHALVAHAQEGGPAPSETDAAARRAFEAGRDAYDHGAFAEALGYFERAQSLRPSPELLYNVGRAADSDGQSSRAITAYTSYLTTYPDAGNRDFVRARLDKMRALERAKHGAGGSAAASSAPAALPSVTQAERAQSGSAFFAGQPGHDDAVQPQRPVWKRAWFWVAIGAVVAGGVVAAAVATRGSDPQRAEADAYVFTAEH